MGVYYHYCDAAAWTGDDILYMAASDELDVLSICSWLLMWETHGMRVFRMLLLVVVVCR